MQSTNRYTDFVEEGSVSRTKSSTKRRSTRSRVWEKVAWFTKKGKGGRENVSCGGEEHEEQSAGLDINNRSDRERRRANRLGDIGCEKYNEGTFNENSLKEKRRGARKSGSFCYLKKRKARQLKHDVCDAQDTATGTFHDFTSESVRSCRQQGSSNTVLNEIARGMQSRCDSKANVQSSMSLPLCDLSMTENSMHCGIKRSESLKRHSSVSASTHIKSDTSAWRSCSFSGAPYNSWPRKKRSSLGNLSVDALSPPQKQKRMSGLKKTATFSGFDSTRINIKDTCRALFKGVRSTPHLPNRSQIKNQDGSTVGIIHFYKNPKDDQSTNTSSQHAMQSAHLLNSHKDLSLTEDLHVQLGKAGSYSKPDETSSHSINVNTSSQQDSQFFDKCPTYSPVECSELTCLAADAADAVGVTMPSCKILGARLLDSYNVYNVTTLSCVSQREHSGRGSWLDNPDEQSMVTEEEEPSMTEHLGCDLSESVELSAELVKDVTVAEPSTTQGQQTVDSLKAGDEVMFKQTKPANISVISGDSLGFVADLHTASNPAFSPASDKVTHHSCTPCLEHGKQSVGCQTELPENTCHPSIQTSPSNDKLSADKVTHHSCTPCLEHGKQSVGCQTELPEYTCHPSIQTSPSNDKLSADKVTHHSCTPCLEHGKQSVGCQTELPENTCHPSIQTSPSNDKLSADKVTHHSCTPCLEHGKQSVGCQTELPEYTCHPSIQTSPSNDKPCAINLADTYAGADVDDNCLPECSSVMREFSVGVCGKEGLCGGVQSGYERTSVKSVMSEKPVQDLELLTPECSTSPAMSGTMFKQHLEVILQYFHKFSDEQKNITMRRLLGQCGVPQMHMLSVAMEPVLHQDCPPNCQDMLCWLPSNVAFHVLSYLDAVSLCRCDQVNKLWNRLVSNPVLWKRLCRIPDWQLSRSSEDKQLLKYRSTDGTIQWKKVLAERFLLRQNWLNGSCKVQTFKGHTQGISCVQFDDSRIASGSSDKTIKVWDTNSGDLNAVLTLAGHSGTVRCLNLNGNQLVSGSVDRSIKVWDLSFESYWSGASCKVTMLGHMHTVRCLQVDNDKVVSGSYDKTLKVWNIKTGHCQLTLRGHNAAVLCVQFDDRKIVSGSYDKTIKVWSLDEGSCLMTLTGHHDAVTCLNLTFDSRKVISGSLDHNLKFWDLATGKSIGTLDWIRSEGHTGVVRCLQSDSWRIVSAGDDKTMKMWSLETGQRLLTLRCHTDGVTCLQFNDFRIVSGSYDQTVKLWNFAPSHNFLSS